jgi:nitrogen fixation protein FixH
MPVQETNDYMMKYQQADININDILKSKQSFDSKYRIEIKDVEMMVMTDNIHSMRVQHDQVKLVAGPNHFSYSVTNRSGEVVEDANVSFLLTRPHTVVDDQMIDHISMSGDRYVTPDINISKPGRYTLQLRVKVGNDTGYSHIEAYLQPKK